MPVRKLHRGTPKKRKRPLLPPENVVYVRFGDLPEGEHSDFGGIYKGSRTPGAYNKARSRAPVQEKGVSCFEAERKPDGSLLIITRGRKGGAARKDFAGLAWSHEEERPLYEVSGDVVGRGASGEPLLRNCTVRRIPLTTAVKLDPPRDRALELVESWNHWRYLDGVREGYRTPHTSDNCLEALAPPEHRGVLHEANERKWARRRTG